MPKLTSSILRNYIIRLRRNRTTHNGLEMIILLPTQKKTGDLSRRGRISGYAQGMPIYHGAKRDLYAASSPGTHGYQTEAWFRHETKNLLHNVFLCEIGHSGRMDATRHEDLERGAISN